jgi:23S rRNA (uridine2552-2'-O)-methyltransferase
MENKKNNRSIKIGVKTAKGRKLSSTRWLQRQLNDPYVIAAKKEGYRSRAAYKIQEIDEKFKIFKKGQAVVDLGAAPGGWSQVVAVKVKAGTPKGGKVIAIDLTEIEAIDNVHMLQGDFLAEQTIKMLLSNIEGKVDVVMSDMAAPSCGHPPTDYFKIVALCEAAYDFAEIVLSEGGVLITKIFRGGVEAELLKKMKKNFKIVKHFKPLSSRADSSEIYVVAIGFKLNE